MSSDTGMISVVILNFNGIQYVEECLTSVLASDYPNFEVLVVDNASMDGSYELLQTNFANLPNVRILRNERNLGFAVGNNVGYSQSKGEIVIFLNVDTRVELSWLRELVEVFRGDSGIAVAQCKMLSMENPEKIDSLGCYLDRLGYVYSWGEWYAARPSQIRSEPFFAEGAAMAVRRSAVDQILLDGEPFDSDYFIYYEDSDLCWRVRLRGFKMKLASDSIVYHRRGFATEKVSNTAVFNSARNRVSTLIKNYDFASLVWCMPLLILFELLRAIVFLRREPLNASAKLDAIVWCCRNLGRIWRRRSLVQYRVRRVPDSQIVKLMLRPHFATLFRSIGTAQRR